MGDFNADASRPPHRALTASGRLVDAFDTADHRIGTVRGTYSHYGVPKDEGRRLDWILVDGGATVELAGVNTARPDGGAVSDHDPVQAVVRWEAQ
jgi:endonuclease/exonuclease/phosphatase family metal-dependent hydrolase